MTDLYIEGVLLRAKSAMLIISDRIQDNFLYLYSDIFNDLRYKQRDIYILFKSLTDTYPYKASYPDYNALILVLVSKCQEVDAYNSTYDTLNPSYKDIDGGTTIVVNTSGSIMQTALVFPTAGTSSYTFTVLISQEVLTVSRGTGTTLRVHSAAPNNEYAQLNSATGEITVSYPFGDGESLWAEYRQL